MKREKLLPALKWVVFSLLLLALYALQTTPGLFEIAHTKPVLIVGLVVCVAMYENVLPSACFAMAAGLLWDISSDKLFGFNGLILLVCGMFISLLCIYYLHTKLLNALIFCAAVMLVQSGLDYLFSYAVWDYPNAWMAYVQRMLPMAAYTVVATLPIFFLVRRVERKLSLTERL